MLSQAGAALPAASQGDRQQRAASKYDFVKVKVWLGKGFKHYYVLSRFLTSRMLTVTKIKPTKAVKIALELKKYLVDKGLLEVSQDKLESILFDIMQGAGFGNDYISRYQMVSRFFQQRRPLIILLCGAPCIGKSTIAQQLASVLNLPNVLQTDILYELLRMPHEAALKDTPLWDRGLSGSAFVQAFQNECHIVRKGLDGDLLKCMRDGKSMIVEGSHLDPGLFLYEFGRYGVHHMQQRLVQASLHAPNPVGRSHTSPLDDLVQPKHKSKHLRGAAFMLECEDGHMSPTLALSSDAHFQADRPCEDGSQEQLPAPSPASEWLLRQLLPAQPAHAPSPMGHVHTDLLGSDAGDSRDTGGGWPDSAEQHRPVFGDSASSLQDGEASFALPGKQLKLGIPLQSQTQQQQDEDHDHRASHMAAVKLSRPESPRDVLDFRAPPKGRAGQEAHAAAPVFVPIVLRMDPREHALLLEDWSGRQQVLAHPAQQLPP